MNARAHSLAIRNARRRGIKGTPGRSMSAGARIREQKRALANALGLPVTDRHVITMLNLNATVVKGKVVIPKQKKGR